MKNLLITLFWFSSLFVYSQHSDKLIVKGVIQDSIGELLIGISVSEKGFVHNKTFTDMDGRFSISVYPNATLSISSIGYVGVEYDIKEGLCPVIVLKEDTDESNFPFSSTPFALMEYRKLSDERSIFIENLRIDMDTKQIGHRILYAAGPTATGSGYKKYNDIEFDNMKILLIDETFVFIDKNFETEFLSNIRRDKHFADNIYIPRQKQTLKNGDPIPETYKYVTNNIYEQWGSLYYFDSKNGLIPMNMGKDSALKYVGKGIYVCPEHILLILPCKDFKTEYQNTSFGNLYTYMLVRYEEDVKSSKKRSFKSKGNKYYIDDRVIRKSDVFITIESL